MENLNILIKYDLFKFWTKAKIITSAALAGLVILFVAGMNVQASAFLEPMMQSQYNGFMTLAFIYATTVSIVGLISFDIKSLWLRTVLTRQVDRNTYLLSKIVSSYINTLIFIAVFFIIPLVITSFMTGIMPDIGMFLLGFLLNSLQSIVFILFGAWLSILTPHAVNILIMLAIIFLQGILGLIIMLLTKNQELSSIIPDYIFPSAFTDILQDMLFNKAFDWKNLVFGILSIGAHGWLAFFLINKIDADKA